MILSFTIDHESERTITIFEEIKIMAEMYAVEVTIEDNKKIILRGTEGDLQALMLNFADTDSFYDVN